MRLPPTVRRAMAPAALVALAAAATWPLTVGGRAIARGDLLLYFYPLRDFAARAAREGRLPLWNPFTFMGAPFLANSQAGFFYPFNLLLTWLPADRAVAWQIGLHLAIASLGAFALARAALGMRRTGALAAGIAFSLGGYLGAQAEHINQLQALAWLPLALLAGLRLADGGLAGEHILARGMARAGLALAGLLMLQVFAGHTQSLYISLAALGLACAARILSARRGARRARAAAITLLGLGAAGALGAALSAAQLAPTLELAGQSARSGGLPYNEVASFSWRPWVAARALLPALGDPLFPEYIATLGAAGLALAMAGAVFPGPGPRGRRVLALALALAGVLLALGVATPLFGPLYRFLPGFNLFRAQARWLAMATLGAALLIGLGADALRAAASARRWRLWLAAWLVLAAAIAAGVIGGARLSPEAEYRGLPAPPVLAVWIGLGALATALVAAAALAPRTRVAVAVALPVLLAAELLLTAQFQPYARASDRQALTDLRPATTHLLVEYAGGAQGRILALSGLFFDPGDLPEQQLIYAAGLGEDAFYDRVIASKHKEILSPNLSLAYGLPSVDGYDGGLLPLRRYADFVGQFVARDRGGTLDGRLREALTGVPAETWLDRMAVRYVIADKTADVFIDGVYYDLLFSAPVTRPTAISLRPYDSTALGVVLGADSPAAAIPFTATADFGGETRVVAGAAVSPTFAARIDLGGRRAPLTLTLEAGPGIRLRGLTSIDATDGSFLSQPVVGEHRMRVVHSGDVKVYENLNPAPRALLIGGDGGRAAATVVDETPERVRVTLPPGAGAGSVVLRDACYPGWTARVDGAPAPIACEEGFFRAVPAPSGAREVVFEYAPPTVTVGLVITSIGTLIWLALAILTLRRPDDGARASAPVAPSPSRCAAADPER